MRVRCRTSFDITVTGVRGSFNSNRLPFQDQSGIEITDQSSWHRARNQQRNWETINQLISLRTLPHSITDSRRVVDSDIAMWEFEFTLDQDTALAKGDDIFGSVRGDCHGVPMITDLTETLGQIPLLEVDRNIWFYQIDAK